MHSRAARTTYLDRIDPYYEVTFFQAILTEWRSVSLTQHRLRPNRLGELELAAEQVFSPTRQPGNLVYSTHAIRVMAWLTQFHQMSTLQLASALGVSPRAAESAARSLYAAGVLRRAKPMFGESADDRPYGGVGALWTVLRDGESPRLAAWLDGLSPLELLLLSGGIDLTQHSRGSSGSTAVRHNMVAAEIALRALEVCPGLVGVWGETHAEAQLLLGEGSLPEAQGQADMVFVDRRGSVIVVEVSGSRLGSQTERTRLANKARNWAAVAARSSLDLKILFLDISQSAHTTRFRWHIKNGVEQTDALLARSADRDKARASVFVTTANDWFPLESTISSSFRTLQSWSLADDRWHDLITSDPTVDATSDVVVNTLAALHTPSWIVRQPQLVL